ncbi:MAG: DUF456 domain-containing protein [Bacteroidales bacterium]|nr:DUF456 domain-containing protein [Bacteroidales bacterium]MCF8403959.1 DUF456 domain-containing protein [Bacteroidales bacterium]
MELDLLWIIIGMILLIVGIIGCVLPVIPGQVLSWGSLLILQLTSPPPFTARFIVIWALITAAVTVLDYYVPIWGTKKLGGSKRGIWGATLGLVIGIFFFPPFGLIIGPFLGAYLGELTAGKSSNVAFKSGLGSFLGFVAGTMMKLAISFIMGYYFIVNAFNL